jgi:lipopolysaccharide/colanic/teichoic acid biosynthesis glycosyltransferase
MSAIPSNQIDLSERAIAVHLKTASECSSNIVLPISFRRKAILDRILAAVLLLPCLPVIVLLVVLVRLTSPGPGIYRQIRVGQNGRLFRLYKIRTMVHDAEMLSGAVWAKVHDPRITRFGKIIRWLHLDEFPQLFNVLKGEMSLVGPRPERPEFVHMLMGRIPEYGRRLAVRPGITGLAQLNLPPDSDLQSVQRKLVLDLQYIQEASAWLDARLMLCTAARMFKLPVIKIFGLYRSVALPQISPTTNDSLSLEKKTLPVDQAAVNTCTLSFQDPKGRESRETEEDEYEQTMPHVLLRSKPG